MKKTIITLLALTGVAAADSITLGSYSMKDGVKYDVVSTFRGKTGDEVKRDYGVTDASGMYFRDYNSLTKTLDTGAMLVTGGTLAEGTQLVLTGISILARDNDSYKGVGSTASLTIGEVTYTAAGAYDDASGFNVISFTFEEEKSPVITMGDTVDITLTNGPLNQNDNKISFAAFKGIYAAPVISGSDWQGAYQLTVKAVTPAPTVPEPTTATLSLLALAGLAARRRRK